MASIYEWAPEGLQKIPVNYVAKETLSLIIQASASGENGSNEYIGKSGELVLKYVPCFFANALSKLRLSSWLGISEYVYKML